MPVSDSARKVRFGIKKRTRPSGASWDQESASYGQDGRMEEWSREILSKKDSNLQ